MIKRRWTVLCRTCMERRQYKMRTDGRPSKKLARFTELHLLRHSCRATFTIEYLDEWVSTK